MWIPGCLLLITIGFAIADTRGRTALLVIDDPVETLAQVRAIEWESMRVGRHRTANYMVFRVLFTDGAGREIETTSKVSEAMARATRPGTEVLIAYSLREPSRIRVVRHGFAEELLTPRQLTVLLLALTGLSLCITLLVSAQELRRQRRS